MGFSLKGLTRFACLVTPATRQSRAPAATSERRVTSHKIYYVKYDVGFTASRCSGCGAGASLQPWGLSKDRRRNLPAAENLSADCSAWLPGWPGWNARCRTGDRHLGESPPASPPATRPLSLRLTTYSLRCPCQLSASHKPVSLMGLSGPDLLPRTGPDRSRNLEIAVSGVCARNGPKVTPSPIAKVPSEAKFGSRFFGQLPAPALQCPREFDDLVGDQ